MKNSVALHEIECDKCGGSGVNYQPSIVELLKRWRKSLGINQKVVAAVCKIPATTYNKFENKNCTFGQSRIRKIIEVLESWGKEGE